MFQIKTFEPDQAVRPSHRGRRRDARDTAGKMPALPARASRPWNSRLDADAPKINRWIPNPFSVIQRLDSNSLKSDTSSGLNPEFLDFQAFTGNLGGQRWARSSELTWARPTRSLP